MSVSMTRRALAYGEVLPDERKDERGGLSRARGRVVCCAGREGRAGDDRQWLGLRAAARGASLWRRSGGATCARAPIRRAPTARPSASSRRGCASGLMGVPTRPRPSAPPRWSLGSTTITPRGRMPLWPTSRRPPACADRRSSVRPPTPFLRPDLSAATTGPPERRKERRRRPAPAGAKRPCGEPPDRYARTGGRHA